MPKKGHSEEQIITNHSLDNTLLTPSNPAIAGEALVIYGPGAGSFDNTPASGAPAGSPLSQTVVTPSVSIGNAAAAVISSGLCACPLG
jgi:uncharacterized protein (TIGR03437 family)